MGDLSTKFLIKMICFALAAAVSTAAHCTDRLHARFEVNIRDGSDLNTVQTAADITPGKPTQYEIGKYRLSLVFDIGDSDAYVLTMTLMPLASPEQIIMQGRFDGRLVGGAVGPLEFKMDRARVKVWGAMALSAIE